MTRSSENIYSVAAFLLFAFLHFVWEILQVPFFAQMPATEHWEAIGMCLKATIGDVAIATCRFCLPSVSGSFSGQYCLSSHCC